MSWFCGSGHNGRLLPVLLSVLIAGCGGGGSDSAISLSSNAELQDLALSSGALDQIFQPSQVDYTSTQGFLAASIRVIPTAADSGATIEIEGLPVGLGQASPVIQLVAGEEALVAIEVTAADGINTKTYTVTIARQSVDELAQQAYVKASNTGAGDLFGASVALSRDTLAVGAFYEDSALTGVFSGSPDNDESGDGEGVDSQAGAVYVFVRDEVGNWNQQAYLKASNAGAGDWFGYSVSLSDETLAVGAPFEKGAQTGVFPGSPDNIQTGDGAVNSGAVYIFTRNETGSWSQQAYLKGSNTGVGDLFGFSVALSDDTLAVGSPTYGEIVEGASIFPMETGAAYVFVRDQEGNWSEQAFLNASNAGDGDQFGDSVALSGNTLAVGAGGEDGALTGVFLGNPDNAVTGDGATDSGAVYLFTRGESEGWSQHAYIKASNTGEGDRFGGYRGVALSGNTLAVGAQFEDSALSDVLHGRPDNAQTGDDAVDSGAVYVFSRDETDGWMQQAYVKASNSGAGDRFGYITLSDETLAVGALLESSALTGTFSGGLDDAQAGDDTVGSGAVYVFVRDAAGLWSQQAYLKASNTGANDSFSDVALSGDTLAVGAPMEDSAMAGVLPGNPDNDATSDGATDSGAVYVYR